MGRNENIAVFEDSMAMCRTDSTLSEAVKASNAAQRMIPETEKYELTAAPGNVSAQVVVSRKRTLEAASGYARDGKKVCVLNFASASNPGGGVKNGSSAQEEAICRCSTLYRSLIQPAMWDSFYGPHRAVHDPLHNDDCIYTPGVVVFKTDTDSPARMPAADWYSVNVLTCAAPNLRESPTNSMNYDGNTAAKITDMKLQQLHEKRMRRILTIAAQEGNDTVILGAFGCGAFRNPPEVVARAVKNVIGEFSRYFDTIEFAVYCSPRDDSNFRVFERMLKK